MDVTLSPTTELQVAPACYFGKAVEIVSTSRDNRRVTIRRVDGTPFTRWSHGGWHEVKTITVRSYYVQQETEEQADARLSFALAQKRMMEGVS